MKRIFFIFLFIWFGSLSFCQAQVVINEIMYDLEGSDTDREWLELYNDGSEPVTIKGGSSGSDSWRIYQKSSSGVESNRTLATTAYQGDMILNSGEYAIVAQNGDSFKNNFPDYSGKIFISSAMSLANTSGAVGLRLGSSGSVWSLVSYSSEYGANGDGNSLQKSGDDFIHANPTPGAQNNSGAPNNATNSDQAQNINTQFNTEIKNQNNKKEWPVEPQIFANAGGDRRVVVGADTVFEGQAIGIEKEPLENARYSWNFGDGEVMTGKNVLHSYKYPAKYVAMLNVSSGEFSASDRIIVDASPADLIISSVNFEIKALLRNYVELHNRSKYELDISFWRLRVDDKYFTFPKNTIILSGSKVAFSSRITGLNLKDTSVVELLYPNGEIAYQYNNLKENDDGMIIVEKIEDDDIDITDPIKNSEEVSKKKDIANVGKIENIDKNLVASVNIASENAFDGILSKWTLGLFTLVIISIIGIISVRRKEKLSVSEKATLADEIEIIN